MPHLCNTAPTSTTTRFNHNYHNQHHNRCHNYFYHTLNPPSLNTRRRHRRAPRGGKTRAAPSSAAWPAMAAACDCLASPHHPPPVQPTDGNKRNLNVADVMVIHVNVWVATGNAQMTKPKPRPPEGSGGSGGVSLRGSRPPAAASHRSAAARYGAARYTTSSPPAQCQVATQKGHSTLSLSRFSRGGNRAASWRRPWPRRGSYTLDCST